MRRPLGSLLEEVVDEKGFSLLHLAAFKKFSNDFELIFSQWLSCCESLFPLAWYSPGSFLLTYPSVTCFDVNCTGAFASYL